MSGIPLSGQPVSENEHGLTTTRMKKLTAEEFRLLKNALSHVKGDLSRSLKRCPELERFTIPLEDGHQLSLSEVTKWVEAARAACWRYGPSEVQRRHLKRILKQQPRG